jgi:hypothetical protein
LTVHAGPAEPSVEVVLANGRRLRVPVGVAAGFVREFVAVLEETPCSTGHLGGWFRNEINADTGSQCDSPRHLPGNHGIIIQMEIRGI